MARNEIGMQMGFNHVADLEAVLQRVLDINADIALRIHHRADPIGADQIGGMGQTAQIKLFEIHGAHRVPVCRRAVGLSIWDVDL